MSTADIDAAVSKTIAEQVKSEVDVAIAVQENAAERVEQAEHLAANVIAAAETTAMGVKLAALEERVNTWQGSSAELSAVLAQLKTLETETHELKQMIAELLNLVTELEVEETEEAEELSTLPISPEQATKNSPQPDEKSAKPAPENRAKASRFKLL